MTELVNLLYHDPISDIVRFAVYSKSRQRHFEKYNKLTLAGVKEYLGSKELVSIVVKPRNILFLGSVPFPAVMLLRNALNTDKASYNCPLSELPIHFPEYFI